MSLDLLSVQDQIILRLKELPQDVYETTAPTDSKLLFDANGNMLPYIVVEFSDIYDSPEIGGIISTKYDLKNSSIIVSCIGPTQRSSRQVANAVRDKLLGYKPFNAGELNVLPGGVTYTLLEPKPARYVSELAFEFAVNTVW